MRVIVEIREGPRSGSRWLLRPGESLSFGRTERSDVILADDASLSSLHWAISVAADGCLIRDLGSTNGTWVGDQRIESQVVQHGDRISAGQTAFHIRFDPPPSAVRDSASRAAQLGASQRSASQLSGREREPEVPSEQGTAEVLPSTLHANAHPDAAIAHATTRSESTEYGDPDQRLAGSDRAIKRDSAGLTLEAQQMSSGIWKATQVSTEFQISEIAARLSVSCPASIMVDTNRTQVPPPDDVAHAAVSDLYLISNLPLEAARLVSPWMWRSPDPFETITLVEMAAGQDGLVVLFSQVENSILLQHFQGLIGRSEKQPGQQSILGLCWSSVLGPLLSDGKQSLVSKIVEPCDAVLVEDSEAPGGWAIYGDMRASQLLKASQIPVVAATMPTK